MKVRVISDLHVEFYSSAFYLKSKLDKMFKDDEITDDEILIIAGDLGVAGSGKENSMNPEYKYMLEYFSKKWKNVILIPGNHEYYDRDKSRSLDEIDTMIDKECKKLGITFLNKNYIILKESKEGPFESKDNVAQDRYAILGCTLWSEATKEAYLNMNDRLKAVLSHKELLQTHNMHKTWLQKTLQSLSKKGIKTIVATHHLPLMELTHPKYLKPKYKHLNSAYASKLNTFFEDLQSSDLSKNVLFYCCGHTHEKTETTLYDIDFLINPMGYPREKKKTKFRVECIHL
jgi:predicted phosphodiesterase